MERAQELRADVQALVTALTTMQAAEPDTTQREFLADCSELVRLHLGYLDALLAGTSRVPEDRVYLGVSSLNKGLAEIGGEWQGNSSLSYLKTLVTTKDFRFFQETSPI